MHPSSIISFYPTYALLDEVFSVENYKKVNFFFDMKNIANSLYMEHAVMTLIENSERYRRIDTSIFTSLMSFIAFHKLYTIKRGIEAKFFVFFETGQSYFHQNTYKKYKIRRKIDDLFGLDRDKRDVFHNIIQMNLLLIERACNKMPDIKVIMLPHLEADFVPYYMKRNKLVDLNSETAMITYSNDHDMWQNLDDHSYVFVKTPKAKKIVRKGQAMALFCKKEVGVSDEYLPLAMSIAGDKSDDIPGVVKGVGEKRAAGIVEDIAIIGGGLDMIFNNVYQGKPLFKESDRGHNNQIINDIIEEELNNGTLTTNLKLSSFEVLSRILDDPPSTEMLDKRKIIEKVMEDSAVTSYSNMKKALEMANVYVDEDTLGTIYYKSGGS